MNEEQSPMTREELIFELGRALGMISRLCREYEILAGMPNTETRAHVKESIIEARMQIKEVHYLFYGKRESEDAQHE